MKNKIKLGMLLCVTSSLFSVWQPIEINVGPTDTTKQGCVLIPRLSHSMGYRAFDSTDNQTSLSGLLFDGATLKFEDVFQFSKMAKNSQVQETTTDTDIAYATSYFGTLADSKININAKQECSSIVAAGSMTLTKDLGGKGICATVGFVAPFEYRIHKMDVNFTDVNIGTDVVAGATNGAIDEFVTRYADVRSFFDEDVIALKGLVFNELQRSFGIGSTKLYVQFDFKEKAHKHFDAFQIAVVLGLPAGAKPDGNTIWPIERGGSGSTQLGAQFNASWVVSGKVKAFVTMDIMKRFKIDTYMRVPKKKVVAAGVAFSASDIIANSNLDAFATRVAIDAYETSRPYFADQRVLTERRLGAILNVKGGIDVDAGPFGFSSWYHFMFKQTDKVTIHKDAPSGTYNTSPATVNTKQRRHSLGWQATYPLGDNANFGIGSEHVVAGRSTPQYHTLFLNFISTF